MLELRNVVGLKSRIFLSVFPQFEDNKTNIGFGKVGYRNYSVSLEIFDSASLRRISQARLNNF